MKKKVAIVVLICSLFLSAGIIAVVLFVKNIDFKKEAVKAREFASIMDDENYEIIDVTAQYESYGIDEAYVAIEENRDYQIEFYELSSESKAKNMFETNKDYFEDGAGNSKITSSYSIGNYNIYSLTSNGNYQYLCRVDNTLLYIDVEDEYKDEVKDIVEELGY
ncbi:MAG: hypothetical protein E7259_10510 [Lachnospiraceae bacterium]|nr:hypothetical protein [Lachnospiraceae bacterium]